MTEIKIYKGMAKTEAKRFIGQLEELEENSLQVKNLDDRVVVFLRRIFDDEIQADEYSRLFSHAIKERVVWLQNLCVTIDKMEQSENAITVDGGCEKGEY